MGLCKCPKRKVTTLFCFEHRVNVCEHCLTDGHPRCIVQSYLNWLKDSDYIPNCSLCSSSLSEGDVVRLICYDVFHLNCLDKLYRNLPSNTAPAGYKCSSCNISIFPKPNQAGRVIDRLKEVLSCYNWARIGLGLPLIEELKQEVIDSESQVPPSTNQSTNFMDQTSDIFDESFETWNNSSTTYQLDRTFDHQSIISDVQTDLDQKTLSRKPPDSPIPLYSTYYVGEDPDRSEDKYRRRSAFSWLSRWIKSRRLRSRGRETRALPRRGFVVMGIFLLAFFTLLVVAVRFGRHGDNNFDFDPLNNPMVHVDEPHFVDRGGKGVNDPLLALQAAAEGA